MKKQRIIEQSLGDKNKGNTDWAHVDNMTEEEVHQAGLADPDAQPTTLDDWKDAVVRKPGVPRGPKPDKKITEMKIRFNSENEKGRIMAFILEKYPEMSINGFMRLAAREKIERETK